jgi:hypothetical protein
MRQAGDLVRGNQEDVAGRGDAAEGELETGLAACEQSRCVPEEGPAEGIISRNVACYEAQSESTEYGKPDPVVPEAAVFDMVIQLQTRTYDDGRAGTTAGCVGPVALRKDG